MDIEWTQGHDEHTWSARIGDIYRLRVSPRAGAFGTICYRADVCNASLDELATELKLPSVDVAKQRAVFLAWNHNNAVADTLLSAIA